MKIFAINKRTFGRYDATDLSFFRENGCHSFNDSHDFTFEFIIDPGDNVTYAIKTMLSGIGNIIATNENFNKQYLLHPLFKATIDFMSDNINKYGYLDVRDIIHVISQLIDINMELVNKLVKYEFSNIQPCINNMVNALKTPLMPDIKKYTLYHVTPTKNVPSIMTYGLQPKLGARSEKAGEIIPAIYLFRFAADVKDSVTNWLGDESPKSEEYSLLAVAVDSYFKRSACEGVVFTTIKPNYIYVIKNNLWDK